MGGGKSSSSSTTQSVQETTSSTATSTGVVGDVIQGQMITYTENLPDNVVDVFEKLVGLSTASLDLTGRAGQAAIDAAGKASQPDLSALETVQSTSSKQLLYIVAGAAAIALFLMLRK